MQQLCRSTAGIEPREVLAGPHEWEVDGYTFHTVLVKAIDDNHKQRSVIDMRSGKRVFRVEGVTAPKTKPHLALQIISQGLTDLITRVGSSRVAAVIKSAEVLP